MRKIRLQLDPTTMRTKLKVIRSATGDRLEEEFEVEEFEVEELKELYKQALIALQQVKYARSHRKPRTVRVHRLPEMTQR